MKHFEVEVLRHAFSETEGHHRIQVGVFKALEELQAKLAIRDGELLNGSVYEVIRRDKFEITQDGQALLNWTSEDADGGSNRMIFNNLTGVNFAGTEYQVYIEQMREKLNFDIRPEVLSITRTECAAVPLLNKAVIGWLDAQEEPFPFTLGFYHADKKRLPIFRFEIDAHVYVVGDWSDLKTFADDGIKPERVITASRSFYEETHKKELEQMPSKRAYASNVFDYWLSQKLADYFK